MKTTYFFYDLETSGLNPRTDRVMQFAGIRTDMDFNQIGDPYDILVKLSDDILPSPEALMITGITPQQTVADGYGEADFAKFLVNEIFTPGTIAVGYNNVRFDDEFVRNTLWRNFQDPYEWSWRDDRSRWDMLDVVRLVRALRPDGIKWPVDREGKKNNRLENLTKFNKIDHYKAHDALSDVYALIAVAKLLREKQPKMYDYLLQLRDKKEIAKLVNLENPQPFVYASGRFDADFGKTTVCLPIALGKNPGSVLVYDLRKNPDDFADWTPEQFAKTINAKWEDRKKDDYIPVPIKELAYNRCPVVAPLGVLDEKSQKRLQLNLDKIQENFAKLTKNRDLVDKLTNAWVSKPDFAKAQDVEGQLYDSFTPDADKTKIRAVAAADVNELADFNPQFTDERLPELLFRYKARNFSQSLSESEHEKWEAYRREKLMRELPGYVQRLAQLSQTTDDSAKQFVLEELQLWVESIMPYSD